MNEEIILFSQLSHDEQVEVTQQLSALSAIDKPNVYASLKKLDTGFTRLGDTRLLVHKNSHQELINELKTYVND